MRRYGVPLQPLPADEPQRVQSSISASRADWREHLVSGVVQFTYAPVSEEERARREAKRKAEAEAARLAELESAMDPLKDVFANGGAELIMPDQKEALLNFQTEPGKAYAALENIIGVQIQLVRQWIDECPEIEGSPVFREAEKKN